MANRNLASSFYFAYGSNMNWQQMQSRCPSARFVAAALLPDHQLAFTRYSSKRQCGVADAVPAKNRNVWGAVYEINASDLSALDRSEGFVQGRINNSYVRRECTVLQKGQSDRPFDVFIYFANPQPNPPLPNVAYKDLILSGARHWRLSDDYIRELEAIKVNG